MMASSVVLALPSLENIKGDSSLNHYRDTGKSAAWFDPGGESTACGTGGYLGPYSHYRFEDHALIFDTSDNTQSSLLGSDLVVAFEDLCFTTCGRDFDYDDVVMGLSMVVVTEQSSALVLFVSTGSMKNISAND